MPYLKRQFTGKQYNVPSKKSNESLAKRFNYPLTCKLYILYLSIRARFIEIFPFPLDTVSHFYHIFVFGFILTHQMDEREPHVQSLGICYRIYYFIMKTLTSQALKTVTLGRSMQFGSTKVQTSREEEVVIKPEAKEQKAQENNSPGMNVNGEEKMVPPGKALKKAVSINDNVEEIDDRKNRKKRSKSFQKSNSLKQQEEEKENIKPLRPILKVKSNLDEKSISQC